jgi:hypothetical protein
LSGVRCRSHFSPGFPLRAASLCERGRVPPFQPPPLRTMRPASRTRPIDPNPGANTPDRYQTGHQPTPVSSTSTYRTAAPAGRKLCASRPPTRGSNRLKDDRQMRAARVTDHEHLAPPIVTTVVAASFRAPRTPSWACRSAKPLSWPEIGGSSPLSVTGVGTLRSGQRRRNDYERLRDTFDAFMKTSTSSGYGNLPWLPR